MDNDLAERDPNLNVFVPQYRALLGMDQVKLIFSSEALKPIAAQAMERQKVARGLRTIIMVRSFAGQGYVMIRFGMDFRKFDWQVK